MRLHRCRQVMSGEKRKQDSAETPVATWGSANSTMRSRRRAEPEESLEWKDCTVVLKENAPKINEVSFIVFKKQYSYTSSSTMRANTYTWRKKNIGFFYRRSFFCQNPYCTCCPDSVTGSPVVVVGTVVSAPSPT